MPKASLRNPAAVVLSGLSLLAVPWSLRAQPTGLPDIAPSKMKSPTVQEAAAKAVAVRLVAESMSLQPGAASTLGLTFDIAEGWNLYWRNPGDSGTPITVKFESPQGVTIGEAQWPTPERDVFPGDLLDYVYKRRVTLLFPIRLDSSLSNASGPVTVRAQVKWLVCREACVMGEREVELTIPISNTPTPSADAMRFEQARVRLPRTRAEQPDPPVAAAWDGRTLALSCLGADELIYFPYEDEPQPADALAAGITAGPRLTLTYSSVEAGARVRGVLQVRRAGRTTFHLVESPPAPPNP